MKKKILSKYLPFVAAILLAASCSKDSDNGIDNPVVSNLPTIEQPAEEVNGNYVKVPFSVKVADGECLSKITYAVAKDGEDNEIWNKVSRTFNAETDVEGKPGAIKLTVTGKENNSGIATSTLNLKYEDSKFVFYGDITVAEDKVEQFNSTDDDDGIDLVGEFSVSGTSLPTQNNISLAKLMESCEHTYKAEFKSNATSITLYDQNAYVVIQMSPLQHTLDVNVGDVTSSYTLNSDGQVWFAVAGGTSIATNFLSSRPTTAGKVSTINRAGLVDLGITDGILWADHNVGADNPWEYGDYYAWGEVAPYYTSGFAYKSPCYGWKDDKKAGYDENWNSYSWYDLASSSITKYTSGSVTLESEDDAATKDNAANRMPTNSEFEDLKDKCYWVWTDKYDDKTFNSKDAAGYIVYKVKNSEHAGKIKYKSSGDDYTSSYSLSDTHIFLPATGYREDYNLYQNGDRGRYWSSSLFEDYPEGARVLFFYSGQADVSAGLRFSGLSVRPVRSMN